MADFTGQNIQDSYQRVVQVDNGQLQDGTGSNLPISFDGDNVTITGSLTAHKYIISSSVTNMVIATNAGSTAFGDSTDDVHTFTGKISVPGTAQDSISTNGSTIAGNKTSARTGSFNAITLTDNLLPNAGEGADSTLTFTGLRNVIRAFGMIDDSVAQKGFGSNVGFIENLASTTGSFGTGTTTIGDNIDTTGNITMSGSLHVKTNITASGNISSSGNVYAMNTVAITGATNGQTLTQAFGSNESVMIENGHITASGNISASGTVTANKIEISPGGYIAPTENNNTIKFSTTDHDSGEMMSVGQDDIQININASSIFQAGINYINIKPGTTDAQQIAIKYHDLQNAFFTVNTSNMAKLTNFVSIMSGSDQNNMYPTDTGLVGGTPTDRLKVYGNINTTSHITASGNISASGHLMTNQSLYVNGKIYSDGDQIIFYDDDSTLNLTGTGGIQLGTSPTQHVTASGNISASGYGHFANLQVPAGGYLRFDDVIGSNDQYIIGNENNITIVGDQFIKLRADDHTQFTNVSANVTGVSINNTAGHITASGNISSSGDIIGDDLTASGDISASGVVNAGTLMVNSNRIIKTTQPGVGNYIFQDGGIDANGEITASGNISASGDNYASAYYTDNYVSLNTNGTQGRVFADTSITGIQIGRNGTSDKNIELLGPVTASGNITASGTVNAFSYFLKNRSILDYSSTSELLRLGYNNDTDTIGIGRNGVTSTIALNASVTASSDISASGYLYGNNATIAGILYLGGENRIDYNNDDIRFLDTGINVVGGHITASGNISSSGYIIANNYVDVKTSGTGYKLSGAKALFVDSGTIIGRTTTDTIITGSTIQLGRGAIANVTASGNISSSGGSGVIQGKYGAASLAFRLGTLQPNGNGGIDIASFGGDTIINVGSDSSITELNFGKIGGSTRPRFYGNITASNNISASGALQIGGLLFTNGDRSLYNTGPTLHVGDGIGSVTVPQLYVNSHITASNNISASGVIIADNFTGSDARINGDTKSNQFYTLNGYFFRPNGLDSLATGGISAVENSVRITVGDQNPAGVGHLVVSASGGEATSNVRVGIGTETPGEMLTVMGNISASAAATVQAGSGSFHYLKGDTTAATGLSVSGYIKATQITASGDISSSGTVSGSVGHFQSATIKGHLTGKNLGNGSSNISGFDSLTIFGNATLGNNGNETHTIKGTTNFEGQAGELVLSELPVSASQIISSGEITASGNIIANGTVEAESFIGQRVYIAGASANISTPTQGTYFYGGSNGLSSNTWNVGVTSINTAGTASIPPQYINNLHRIPCGVKTVTLKSYNRIGSSQIPAYWIFTGSMQNDSNNNISMGFAASQSIHASATNDGVTTGTGTDQYNIDITGSKSFTPNPGHELIAVAMINNGSGTQAWRFNYRLDGISTE